MTDKKKLTAFRLEAELFGYLKDEAVKEHRSLNNHVENILKQYKDSRPTLHTPKVEYTKK